MHEKADATKATLVAKAEDVKARFEAAADALRPRKEYHFAFSGSGALALFQLGVSAALADYGVYSEAWGVEGEGGVWWPVLGGRAAKKSGVGVGHCGARGVGESRPPRHAMPSPACARALGPAPACPRARLGALLP